MEWKQEYEQAITRAAEQWAENALHDPATGQFLYHAPYEYGIRLKACPAHKAPAAPWVLSTPETINRGFTVAQCRAWIANIARRLPILDPEM